MKLFAEIKKRQIVLLLFAMGALLVGSCHPAQDNAGSKATNVKKQQTVAGHGKGLPQKDHSDQEDFDEFFKKFKTDPVFQKARIKFPLKYTMSGDESGSDSITYIEEKKLPFIKLFTSNKDKGGEKKQVVNSEKISIQFQIEDTGYEKDFLFERPDGKWQLNSVTDSSD